MSSISTSPQPGSARCAVWHAEGTTPPRDLLQALLNRGVTARPVCSSYLALAECCAVPGERAALVMVDPERGLGGERVRAMVDAMSKYAPSAPVWVYDERSAHRLRAYTPSPGQTAKSAPARPSGPPKLRLAGDSAPEPAESSDAPVVKSGGSLLSDEELAMLLNDEPPTTGSERLDS